MRILAIETSCDETAISLLETKVKPLQHEGLTFVLLAHEVASQIKLHTEWGGVVPMLAKREHLINLPLLLEKVLPESNLISETSPLKPDLIAVTYGPGLEPALWTGINFARELATKWHVPLVPTDHMEGHIVSALLKQMSTEQFEICKLEFPAIALLISGAHTQLVLIRNLGEYEVLGTTRDDAVGEAFDKVARMMGLPYPGGPEISKLASRYLEIQKFRHVEISRSLPDRQAGPNIQISLPRPMLHSGDLDFSFSGLKTAVLYLIKKLKEANKIENDSDDLTEEQKSEIAHEFEEAVTEVLTKKTLAAIEKYDAKSLLVGGGVVANKRIREALVNLTKLQGSTLKLYLPDMKFTGDNATMIGIAAYLHSKGGTVNLLSPGSHPFDSLRASGNLSLYK